MPVSFENYSHSFLLKGKQQHIFVPSERGRCVGADVKQRVEAAYSFDDFYYHLRKGGHVAALHSHRANTYFCKIDIKNFFYSIARNRVVRILRMIGVPCAQHYGKWSCVKNPYVDPHYALPYGFVQSPILAALVLAKSEIGRLLNCIALDVTVSVYVDDISLSSNDRALLQARYDELLLAVDVAAFTVNAQKCVPPCRDMTVFNCSLRNGDTVVTPDRIAQFNDVPRSVESLAGFERYCDSVKHGNAR